MTPGPRSRDVAAVAVLLMVLLLSVSWLWKPELHGDGFAYYMWLEAIVRDRTIELDGPAEHYAEFHGYLVERNSETGRLTSMFAFGSAFLLAPFYRAAFAVDAIRGPEPHKFGWWRKQGDTRRHIAFACAGTAIYGIAALLLSYALARSGVGAATSLFACLACWFGTPLLYYAGRSTSMSHALACFPVAAVFLLARSRLEPERLRAPRELGAWISLGLAVAVAGLVRWQLIMLAVPLALVLVYRRRIADLAAFTLAVALPFASVPLLWLWTRGSTSPKSVGSVPSYLPIGWWDTLASPVHGLFIWTPLSLLGLTGLALMLGDRRRRVLAAVLLSSFALQVLVNSAVQDPEASFSFGMRRLTEMTPALAVGLAWLIGAARAHRGLAPALIGTAAGSAIYTMILLRGFLSGEVHPEVDPAVEVLAAGLRGI